VAALNTTHHFNYLFGHKTVEVEEGVGSGADWPTFGTVFVSWRFEIVKFNKLPAIFIALQAHSRPTQARTNPFRLFSVLFGPAHRLFSLYSLVLSELANLFMTKGREIQYF